MGETDKLEISTTLDASQAADHLSRIADGLRAGVVTLKSGEQVVRLDPGKFVRLEIEAESKPKKHKGSLQFELSWKESTEPDDDNGEPLEITAGAPTDNAGESGA